MHPKLKRALVLSVAAFVVTGCTAPSYTYAPNASADQTVRFDRGTPTILQDKEHGSAQTTPIQVTPDGDRIVLGLAVFNKDKKPVNFGIDDISVSASGMPLKAYTKEELVHEAKVHAAWMTALTVQP